MSDEHRTTRPAPFERWGIPSFTVREKLPWFVVSGGGFLLFLWWLL